MPPPQCQPFPEEGVCQREVVATRPWPSCCVTVARDLVGIRAVKAEPVWFTEADGPYADSTPCRQHGVCILAFRQPVCKLAPRRPVRKRDMPVCKLT